MSSGGGPPGPRGVPFPSTIVPTSKNNTGVSLWVRRSVFPIHPSQAPSGLGTSLIDVYDELTFSAAAAESPFKFLLYFHEYIIKQLFSHWSS